MLPAEPTAEGLDAPLLAYQEWLDSCAADEACLTLVPLAIRELLQSERIPEAAALASQALPLTREQAIASPGLVALRVLGMTLASAGDVARMQGAWEQAGSVYLEGLGIVRYLLERLGASTGMLCDLSSALDDCADMARAQQHWERAQALYRESLGIKCQLLVRCGATSHAMREVAMSLECVGDMANEQRCWQLAEAAYRESLVLRRQLVEAGADGRRGVTCRALEDLACCLVKLVSLPSSHAPELADEAVEVYEQLLAMAPHEARYREWLSELRRVFGVAA